MAGTAVYICDCMGLVSNHVDTASLEALAGTLDGVSLVKRAGILCGRDDLARWAGELKEAGVERLLFVGCSPRMSLKLPEEALERLATEAGLDPSMVEVANVREQCAWVHPNDADGANAKARALLRMAHARLAANEATAPEVPLERKVLVVGGGPAGLAAARDLSLAGMPSVLVEKGAFLGGKLCQLPFMFQNETWPSTCESSCTGPVHSREAHHSPLVTVHTSAEVTDLRKEDGNFVAEITRAPRFVDEDRCISCDLCAEVCPEVAPDAFEMGHGERKAISKPFLRAVPDTYSIVDEACTRCGDCVPVCPTDAIDLSATTTVVEEIAGAVILATGTEQRDPALSPELGAGHADVITSMEFERLLATGLRRPSDGEEPEAIVFVQCAGSRAGMDRKGSGVPYCSRTCCAITAKQAKRVSMNHPMTEVSVLYYRDFRTYERALEKLYQDVYNLGVEFHNGDVFAIEPGDEGLDVKFNKLGTEELEDEEVADNLEADLVVLACAQEARLPEVVQKLGMPTDVYGFPIEGQPRLVRPTETFVERVYAAGAAAGPKAIQPSVEQGTAAAMKAVLALGAGGARPHKHVSSVDPERCSSCGMCVSVCPHGAVAMTDNGAHVDGAFCQACGLCGASCPSHAAGLRNFSDEVLLRQAAVAFEELPAGEPKMLALLCYWCSYGCADLAGVHRLEVPSCVRPLRIRCSSSVNMGLIMEMFRMGVDGVLVGGCPDNSCHHMWGNWLAQKRTALMKTMMRQMGLDERRLKYETLGIMHAGKFADECAKMRAELTAMGPNPWTADQPMLQGGKVSWLQS